MATATDVDTIEVTPLGALMRNAAVRQFVAMVAIAASVALGIAVVLWTRTPSMGALYDRLDNRQLAEVSQALDEAGLNYEIEHGSGRVLVEKSRLDETLMMLAAQNLPSGDGSGMEILDEDQEFGMSSLRERIRYEHAREIELARSIATLKWVRSARVHIARGNDSVFVRDRQPATASVVLDVMSGRTLPRENIQAIVHLVASGIPNLDPDDVTVVDQFSNLLSSPGSDDNAALSERQFEHKKRKERALVQKVDQILAPVVGVGRYRAQVNANLDFTVSEQTSELFDPAASTVRSERETVNESRVIDEDGGVPGALANQPPLTGRDPEPGDGATVRSSSDTTRNFDPGRRITTVVEPVGEILRLSVAVAIDNVRSVDEEGNATDTPRTAEQLADIERLVREAVGFDEARGDTIQVINSAFQSDGILEAPSPPEFWQEPWFLDLVRQGIGLLIALIVFFKVLRPMARGVIDASMMPLVPPEPEALPEGEAPPPAIEDNSATIEGEIEEPPEPTIEERVDSARQVVGEDAERVANIMKEWVGDEDE